MLSGDLSVISLLFFSKNQITRSLSLSLSLPSLAFGVFCTYSFTLSLSSAMRCMPANTALIRPMSKDLSLSERVSLLFPWKEKKKKNKWKPVQCASSLETGSIFWPAAPTKITHANWPGYGLQWTAHSIQLFPREPCEPLYNVEWSKTLNTHTHTHTHTHTLVQRCE